MLYSILVVVVFLRSDFCAASSTQMHNILEFNVPWVASCMGIPATQCQLLGRCRSLDTQPWHTWAFNLARLPLAIKEMLHARTPSPRLCACSIGISLSLAHRYSFSTPPAVCEASVILILLVQKIVIKQMGFIGYNYSDLQDAP